MRGLIAVVPNFEGMVTRVVGVRGEWHRQGEAGDPAAQELCHKEGHLQGQKAPAVWAARLMCTHIGSGVV